MTTNYYTSRRTTGALNIRDIAVGDKLVRADWKFAGYQQAAKWIEREFTVTKVLKTRLVLEAVNPDGHKYEIRMLVENGKYSYNSEGDVKAQMEGQSQFSRTSYYFFTPDEPMLAELRDEVAESIEKQKAKDAARASLEAFKLSLSVEDAEAAIQALQVFVDNNKK